MKGGQGRGSCRQSPFLGGGRFCARVPAPDDETAGDRAELADAMTRRESGGVGCCAPGQPASSAQLDLEHQQLYDLCPIACLELRLGSAWRLRDRPRPFSRRCLLTTTAPAIVVVRATPNRRLPRSYLPPFRASPSSLRSFRLSLPRPSSPPLAVPTSSPADDAIRSCSSARTRSNGRGMTSQPSGVGATSCCDPVRLM